MRLHAHVEATNRGIAALEELAERFRELAADAEAELEARGVARDPDLPALDQLAELDR